MSISTSSKRVNDINSTTYGLYRDSLLNSSHYFHITDGLCPDVMHDVLEGCAQFEVKELIMYLINKKYITLNFLNSRLESFPYCGSDASDKPTLISSSTLGRADHSMKQKGTAWFCYVLHAPKA